MFLNGCTDLNDNVCASWPNIIEEETINIIRWLLEQDAWVWVYKTEKYFQDVVCNLLSHGTIFAIIHNCLEKKKVSMRWIPKILTDDLKMNRLAAVAQFVTQYNAEGTDCKYTSFL